jgi:hypothetical protein
VELSRLRKALVDLDPPVIMEEPTGAETSSNNGKVERSVGMAGVTTQLLLAISNIETILWCFALLHGVLLLNVCLKTETDVSPFQQIFKKKPHLSTLRIFGSTMCKVSAARSCIWLGLHGMRSICNFIDNVIKRFGHAHHYVTDELDTATFPGERSLAAAKVLNGLSPEGDLTDNLTSNLLALGPNVSPWLSNMLVNYSIKDVPPGQHLGFKTLEDNGFTRVKVIGLVEGSFARQHLKDTHIVGGHYLLAINTFPMVTNIDISSEILDDATTRTEAENHNVVSGFLMINKMILNFKLPTMPRLKSS